MTVALTKLSKTFGETPVVQKVSLTIEKGQWVTLLGPSGCGKTTVLRMVAGLETPSSGVIRMGETVLSDASTQRFISPHLRGIGMVFQSYALWPHLSVFQNVAFPLQVKRVQESQLRDEVMAALVQVGLQEYSKRYPHELSGGQQQRVALARALVRRPEVLLLDEPLSNLDARLRQEMRQELKSMQRRLGVTTLYVTHDRLEALDLSHQVAVLDHGKLVQFGTPEELTQNPVNDFVASFVRGEGFETS